MIILSPNQIVVLRELVTCNSIGYPRSEFIKAIRAKGIADPIGTIKDLKEAGLLRFDQPDRHRPEGAYKPLPEAYRYTE